MAYVMEAGVTPGGTIPWHAAGDGWYRLSRPMLAQHIAGGFPPDGKRLNGFGLGDYDLRSPWPEVPFWAFLAYLEARAVQANALTVVSHLHQEIEDLAGEIAALTREEFEAECVLLALERA